MQQDQKVILGQREFVVIKPERLRKGVVLWCAKDNVYARLGEKQITLEEQIHTISLYDKGFPVPRVIESGAYGNDQWYFVEESLGEMPFLKQFIAEYKHNGKISDELYSKYLAVIKKYTEVQVLPKNASGVSIDNFIEALIPDQYVLPSLHYFDVDINLYHRAISRVANKLADAPMGLLQFDLNPYNIMDGGIIDFEMVGYGPIGYDTLMSAIWAFTWFTNYPSYRQAGYWLSDEQVKQNNDLVDASAVSAGYSKPTEFYDEFLLLKTAWTMSDLAPPSPDWPQERLAFKQFRVNLFNQIIEDYLDGRPLDYRMFSKTPGGEL